MSKNIITIVGLSFLAGCSAPAKSKPNYNETFINQRFDQVELFYYNKNSDVAIKQNEFKYQKKRIDFDVIKGVGKTLYYNYLSFDSLSVDSINKLVHKTFVLKKGSVSEDNYCSLILGNKLFSDTLFIDRNNRLYLSSIGLMENIEMLNFIKSKFIE